MLYSYRISLSFTYFLIIVMNIEQCFALKWPFLARQHVTESNAKKLCFGTFLFALSMGIPSGMLAGIIILGSGKYSCLAKEANKGFAFQIFYQIQTIFGILIFPHFVLLILSIILIIQIKGIASNTYTWIRYCPSIDFCLTTNNLFTICNILGNLSLLATIFSWKVGRFGLATVSYYICWFFAPQLLELLYILISFQDISSWTISNVPQAHSKDILIRSRFDSTKFGEVSKVSLENFLKVLMIILLWNFNFMEILNFW